VICSTAFNSSANGAKAILRNVGYWQILLQKSVAVRREA
jgi:hypothetical protein